VIISHVIARRQPYQEFGADSVQHRDPAARAQRLVHQLAHLGFEVPLLAQPLPTPLRATSVRAGGS